MNSLEIHGEKAIWEKLLNIWEKLPKISVDGDYSDILSNFLRRFEKFY